jgi:hypothetical protein
MFLFIINSRDNSRFEDIKGCESLLFSDGKEFNSYKVGSIKHENWQ